MALRESKEHTMTVPENRVLRTVSGSEWDSTFHLVPVLFQWLNQGGYGQDIQHGQINFKLENPKEKDNLGDQA